MKTKKRNLSIAALSLTLLAIPLVFGFGLVDIRKNVQSAPSTTSVFMDPEKILKDYLLDPGYQVGDTFQVHLNISDAADLYTWNVNTTWNPAILNFTQIVSYGDFLAQTASPNGTSRIVDIMNVSNETGYAAIAESILGNYTGVSGSGRLVTIEFLIVDYGSTDLTVSINGTLPTELLNSTGNSMPFTTIDGYFRNRLFGDANGDKTVDIFDIGTISAHWFPGPPVGPLGYDREADINLDGAVDIFDIGITSANWGRTVP